MREMTDGAREIAQFNLPFMDGTHECIPRLASGQLFFEGIARSAKRLGKRDHDRLKTFIINKILL
jgi:hypothetical protein